MSVDFYSEFQSEVGTKAEVEGDFQVETFTAVVGEHLAEAGDMEDLQVAYFEGTGSRNRNLRVDGYDLSNSDESIVLVVSDYFETAEPRTVRQAEITGALNALFNFLKESTSGQFRQGREESSQAYQLAYDLELRGNNASKYKLFYLTNGVLGGRAKALDTDELLGVPVEFHVWDIRRLEALAASTMGREELVIDLTKWVPAGVEALEVRGSADSSIYLAALPGQLLADLYEAHGSRLLESNVRSYLSNRGKVNKGIRQTVYREPDRFLAFNNGITATAANVELSQDGRSIRTITDLQIVNGGQTTASLFYVAKEKAKLKDWDLVNVPMKLVVVDAESASRLVPDISRYANSQNAVSTSDFFSNAPFHVRLEELARRTLVPAIAGQTYQTKWFYERTKGQYFTEKNRLSKSESLRFEKSFPRLQVLTKTDLAKYEMSWMQRPSTVSSGAQKNFSAYASVVTEAWNKKDGPESINVEYFKDIVARSILFNSIRRAVQAADWYEAGYLANIVTYTVSRLAHIVQTNHRLGTMNFADIWNRQAVDPVVLEFALQIAVGVKGVLTSPTREVQNVTEWAKKESCWVRVKALPLEVPPELSAWMVDPYRAKERKVAAVETEKLNDQLRGLTRLYEIPQESWQALEVFATERQLGAPADHGILKMMVAGGRKVPSDPQATRLLKFVATANSYGFSDFEP